jgi:hypothetical protein
MIKNIFLISILFLIYSCSKDSSTSNNTQSISGRWKLIKAYDKNFPNSIEQNLYKSSSYAIITENSCAFHWTDSIPSNSKPQHLQFSYTKDGTKLYVSYGYYNIDLISSSQLILSGYDSSGYAQTILLTK